MKSKTKDAIVQEIYRIWITHFECPLNGVAYASYLLATQIKEIFLLNDLPQIKRVTDSNSLTDTLKTSNASKDWRLRVVVVAMLRETEDREERDQYF